MKNKKFTFSSLNAGSVFLRAFFLLLGIMMLAAGFGKLYYYVDFRLMGFDTFGVIEHPATTTVMGGRPLIRYEDALGNIHEFRSRAKTHWFHKPQKGETLRVIYKKQESQSAIVNNVLYYVILPLGFIVVGCFFTLQAVSPKKSYSFLPSTPFGNGARL